MIIAAGKQEVKVNQQMRGGTGEARLASYAPTPHCRLISEITLEQGCSIGDHIHEHEAEVFYIISGEGIYNDNGTEHIVRPGDVAYCMSGESHSIRNEQAATLKLLAVIITEAE